MQGSARRGAGTAVPGAARAGTVLLAAGAAGVVAAGLLLFRAYREPPPGSWEAFPAWPGWLALAAGTAVIAAGLVLRLRARAAARLLPATFLRPEEEERVLEEIRRFEARTSGEIRVHLAERAGDDILAAAREAFERLGMAATAERNGVLFYVATAERRFAVLGDRGIDEKVPDGFWDDVVARVRERFAEGRFADGLAEGIAMAGEQLAAFFPHRPDDVNELPDDISRD